MKSRKNLLDQPDVREAARLSCTMIDSYCRVLEVHIKTVEQVGLQGGKKTKEVLDLATGGLVRELKFLSFLTEGGDETDN